MSNDIDIEDINAELRYLNEQLNEAKSEISYQDRMIDDLKDSIWKLEDEISEIKARLPIE
jgi:peptidoglycan hydrolase CwlO-like protein